MIIEAVFAQMFRLPASPNVEIFYHSLILELCKLQPSDMPMVLVQATEMLFNRLHSMNIVCIERSINTLLYCYHSTIQRFYAAITLQSSDSMLLMAVCCFRFVNWLSYHLSNFQFQWTWAEWSEVLRQDPMTPKAMFVRELLNKSLWYVCTRTTSVSLP